MFRRKVDFGLNVHNALNNISLIACNRYIVNILVKSWIFQWNFFDGWKLSLSIILRIFLIFGDLSLDDSYKLNSYKKSVYYTHRVFYYAQIHTQCIALVNRSKIWTLNHGKFTKWLRCPDRLPRHENFRKELRNFILILSEMPSLKDPVNSAEISRGCECIISHQVTAKTGDFQTSFPVSSGLS